jgi:hypothetical protein
MDRKPTPQRILLLLIVGLLLLPLVAWTIVGVAALLGAMGDGEGRILLNRLAALCGGLWVVDLVCLVVLQAFRSLGERDPRE